MYKRITYLSILFFVTTVFKVLRGDENKFSSFWR